MHVRALLGKLAAWQKGLKESQAWQNLEWILLILLVLAGVSLGVTAWFTNWSPYRGGDDPISSPELLAAIATGLAAILALLVTITLVVTQLAAQAYSPRLVAYKLTDPWLWMAIGIYAGAILLSLVVLGAQGLSSEVWDQEWVGMAVVLTGVALAYLIPFTIATLKSLHPQRIAEMLVGRGDMVALDDMLRLAVNEGRMSVLSEGFTVYSRSAMQELEAAEGELGVVKEISDVYDSIGRHAAQRHNPDAAKLVIKHLTGMIQFCNKERHVIGKADEIVRQWRNAAVALNEELKTLETYIAWWFERMSR